MNDAVELAQGAGPGAGPGPRILETSIGQTADQHTGTMP